MSVNSLVLNAYNPVGILSKAQVNTTGVIQGGAASASVSEKPSVTVSISREAREAWAAERHMSAEQLSNADRWLKEASELSRAQGLPEGKYDFSRMTGSQLENVVNHLIVNEGVNLDNIRGLLDARYNAHSRAELAGPGQPEEIYDFISMVEGFRDYEASIGNALNAAHMQISLSFINSRFAGSEASTD